MRARTQHVGAVLIVNDDFDAALEADGWHAGQDDLAGRDLARDRAKLGDRLFGVSCGIASEAIAAVGFGADYVGTGPFAGTASKEDAGAPIGAAGIAAVVAVIHKPVVAIGGIGLDDLAAVRSSGAAMAAVIAAIAHAPNPEQRTRELVARWASLR